MIITLTFELAEVQTVVDGLVELPYKRVGYLVERIKKSTDAQVAAGKVGSPFPNVVHTPPTDDGWRVQDPSTTNTKAPDASD